MLASYLASQLVQMVVSRHRLYYLKATPLPPAPLGPGGLEAWRPGGLEAWRPGGLGPGGLEASGEAWRPGGLEAWRPGGLEAWRPEA